LKNPYTIFQELLHLDKIGVWIGISRTDIRGPVFFAETVHSKHYSQVLLSFIGQLGDEINNSFFQLDGVTVHTANSSTELLEEVLENA
jgi:hypothetical protein